MEEKVVIAEMFKNGNVGQTQGGLAEWKVSPTFRTDEISLRLTLKHRLGDY